MFACHYYGPGINLAFQLYAMFWLLLAYVFLPATAKECVFSRLPKLVLAVSITLLLIAVHHFFLSQSKDSSFSVSLVVATLPLLILFSTGLGERPFIVLFWVCAAFAGYAAVRYLWFGERAYTPLLDPGVFATLLYLAWIPWTHRQLSPGTRETSGFAFQVGGLAAVFSLALLATHSRFAMLALGLIVSAWWLLSLWQTSARRVLVAVSLGVLLGAALYVGFAPLDTPKDLSEQIFDGAKVAESPRWLMLKSTLAMALGELPGVGVGLYGFSLLYPQYRSLDEQDTVGLFAHNDYAQLAVEGGLMLLVPLLVLIGWTLFNGGRLFFQRGVWAERLGYWLAASLALLHAAFNFVFYILALVVLLGVVLGAAVAQRPVPAGRPGRNLSSAGGVLVTLGILAILAIDVFTYGVFSGHGGVPGASAVREAPVRMLTWADIATRVNDDRSVPRLALAQLYTYEQVVAEAGMTPKTKDEIAELYSEAIAIDPWNPYAYVAFADYLGKNGGKQAAREALLLKARDLAPQDPQVALVLVRFYVDADDTKKARAIAQTSMRWCELQASRARGAQLTFLQTVSQLGLEVDGLARCWVHYQSASTNRRAPPPLLEYFKAAS